MSDARIPATSRTAAATDCRHRTRERDLLNVGRHEPRERDTACGSPFGSEPRHPSALARMPATAITAPSRSTPVSVSGLFPRRTSPVDVGDNVPARRGRSCPPAADNPAEIAHGSNTPVDGGGSRRWGGRATGRRQAREFTPRSSSNILRAAGAPLFHRCIVPRRKRNDAERGPSAYAGFSPSFLGCA